MKMTRKKTLLEKVLTPKQLEWCKDKKNKNNPKLMHMIVSVNATSGALYYPTYDAKMDDVKNHMFEFKKYLESMGVIN